MDACSVCHEQPPMPGWRVCPECVRLIDPAAPQAAHAGAPAAAPGPTGGRAATPLSGFSVAGRVMRPEQKQILSELERLVSRGARNIIVSAPTGVGKSYVAKAVAEVMGPAWIVTSTKHLQDQYAADFGDIRTIKGMANFPCLQLMGKSGTKVQSVAMKKRMTCDNGQCVTRDRSGKIIETCDHKKVVNEMYDAHENDAGGYAPQVAPDCKPCHYYLQKAEGLHAAQAAVNYAMYFMLVTKQRTKSGVSRPAVVFDEAHTIEDEAVRFVSKDIRASYFTDTRLAPTNYDMLTIDGVLDMLLDLRKAYAERLRAGAPDGYSTAERIMRHSTMERRYDIVSDIWAAIRANRSNFVLQDPVWNGGEFKSLSVAPLNISKMLPDLLGRGLNVFMSATLRPAVFARTIGLDSWESVEIKKSPFPASHRSMRFLDVARITAKSPPADEIRVARRIDGIISEHRGERGLILTSSKARCRNLLSRLGPAAASRVTMAHSEGNAGGLTMKQILKRHAATPGSILLSSSLWQGVDLKGDLSKFQIVEKCPWPFLGDRRVEAMARADRRWYEYQTIVKVLQGFGRSVRGPDDSAITYVMDSAVGGLLRSRKDMVPAAYHDVLYDGGGV